VKRVRDPRYNGGTVINALFAACSIEGRDGRRVDAPPVDEAITILQQ